MSMHNMHPGRSRRDAAKSRALLILAAVVLFAGLFAQITMLSRISSQNKRAAALEKEIVDLSARAENMELSINQYHDLDVIEERARQLGMSRASETQIRVVSVAQSYSENTPVQSAGMFGAERVIN